ncbi:glycoside hydrolase family 2 TIM barrel-domain containing protein [Fimbriimonas ginsengisoli]|uniref:Beta-galactosidase n=1 Tax=Fimbriimonas ginsengisoli Gsoil 348 TaxID=661478 RepID=A0A068NSK5_FIMGI|nr:glycoside hydrolase family 2 TIM barrel-domain containing protein [Fimbriimonas ginsengisoli]AIE86518.1 glycoside hydrolase family 2 TIM barrel [Fimbriimonas ginsengisoli Gsoil 348]
MLSLLLVSLSHLSAAAVPPEIEDEQCLGINKAPYHSTLVPYGTLQEALRADRAKSSYARSLNGPWKFNWVKRPELRPAEFYRPTYDVSKWKTISVPSNWQVLGYGTPYYRNNGYTFQKDWPRVMSEPPKDWTAYDERNPVGSYRRNFKVPASWDGREVFLKFDGVDAGFFLWVNGQKVGYSQNSRNAAEFDVTKFLKPGANDVAVEVYRYTAGTYFEDQDMWRLSGIFRNVTLWSAPKLHIRDTFVTSDLDSAYKNATLKVTAKVHNYGDKPSAPSVLKTTLFDLAGASVRGVRVSGAVPSIPAGGEATVTLSSAVADPQKWTAETPNLYTAVLNLGDGKEILSHRVGFRKVEIKGRVFMINGKPVKLKGANRHEMNPNTGHYVTEADMVQDLVMLKRANCNHVRTCHYSDDPRWYELCDEWGIYLVAEANLECHGYYGVIDHEPRFERMVVDRNVANVENFKNHASVVIWSMGNECGGGSNLRSAERVVRSMDSSRPTHYEAFGEGAGNPASIDSHMYTDPDGLERIANSKTLTKPMYLCEYAHAMNNSMGAIGEYNDLFDKYPALMGGAIWEWEDQGLWNRRDPKHPILAYGGGFGEKPNDGYFIHKGVVFSDRSPKPHFPEVKRAYQWIGFADLGGGKVKVKNKFAFTNLSKYGFKWTIVSDAGTVASSVIPALSLEPGAEKVVNLALPKIERRSGESLYLNIAAVLKADEKWARKGDEIANAQFPLVVSELGTAKAPAGDLSVDSASLDGIKISGSGFAISFDRRTGAISGMSTNGRSLLLPGGGPKLHLWRAQHRIDDGWAAAGWYAAGLQDLKAEVLNLDAKKGAGGEVVVSSSIRYLGKNGFSVLHLATYAVYADGTVAVDNAVSPAGKNIALARIGVRMLLDPSLNSLTYFARGPMENYADRKRGSDIGRYVSTVNQQFTPYEKPQECGNHEDMKWLSLAGQGGPRLSAIANGEPLQFSALPYRDEDMEDVPYRVDLPKSRSTVLILSAKTLGVGSAACGPRPLPQYRLDCTPRRFSYVLRLGGNSELSSIPKRSMRPVLVSRAPDGRTSLAGDGPVETSTDGNVWTSYHGAFTVIEPTKLWVRTPGFTGQIVVDPPPANQGWKATASDFEPGEGDSAHVLDNDPTTIWHSRYTPRSEPPPHRLTVDLLKPTKVGRVTLTPRQDGSNGRIRAYVIETSDDGSVWEAAARGELRNRGEAQTVPFTSPRTTRYIRLTVLSDWSNAGWASLAEFDARE